ncbi:hypothetical protein CERSUDRAFT_113687 [Gelatoporia subvermispora B]|uniref:Uncharacterized protein n=1 Tax=Ceriporiopsis subvermispora (strain B) TaxID=914234 RepID=M2RJ74_CERS8|nr:hypothetical protein CERSUDRAFT_113687 [Gelatoporia subvermispora B]
MSGSHHNASSAATRLGDLLAQLPLGEADKWNDIELTAQALADQLRVKDVEQQTTLGKTPLPQTLTSLLKGAINGASLPDSRSKPAVYEILRVGANLCMDHDVNRGCLLEAGFPQIVVSLLEGYAESLPSSQTESLPLTIPDLKIVKTAVGVLLNASLGYEPAKSRLKSLEAAMTILRLSMAVYVPAWWIRPSAQISILDESSIESWNLRTGMSSWAWRVISELREDETNKEPQALFGPDVLPVLVQAFAPYVSPPRELPQALVKTPRLLRLLIQTDFEILEDACGLLESLCLDVVDIRLSLARGLTFPDEHGGIPCLSDMLAFVERGDYPPYWSYDPPSERTAKEKGLDICKAAIIKAIVEVAGDEKNTDILWDDSEEEHPGGKFVSTMVQWIRTHKSIKETNRDDLLICATLSLGNLVRRDAHSTAIVKPPISLAPELTTILAPETDIKVKHGVVALLKHLAQSAGNRASLGEAGIIQYLAASGVWGETADIAEIVQVSAIGIAKHMCNGNADNAYALILSSESASNTAMDQILALVRRSDSIAVKSEGTRVLVNVIKTLWSTEAESVDEEKAKQRRTAMDAVANTPCASALAQLIGRSKKYPILINEGVVSLTLLSTHSAGGTLVLDSILNPLPTEAVRSPQSVPVSAATSEGSPTVHPRHTLDMLVYALRNADNNMPAEVRANVCALLGQLGRKGTVTDDRALDLQKLKDSTRDLMESASREQNGNAKVLAGAAQRALEAWR